MQMNVTFDDSAIDQLAKEGFDPAYGARPIRREIQTKVEDQLAEAILYGKVKEGDDVAFSAEEEKIVLKKK